MLVWAEISDYGASRGGQEDLPALPTISGAGGVRAGSGTSDRTGKAEEGHEDSRGTV